MSEAKYTPGPWRISQGNIGNTIEAQSGKKSHEFDDGFRVVAMAQSCEPTGRYVKEKEKENAEANINLIAAAPELYRLLEAGLNLPPDDEVEWFMWADRATTALAKARGEKC